MDIRNNLKDSIAKSLSGLGISVEADKVPLEHPADLRNGDYSTSIAIRALALEREPAKRKLEKNLPKDEVKGLSKIVALPSRNPHALGESVSRLFQFSGATVKRANYQGDVGIHVAKSIYILLEKNISEPTIADLSAAYPECSKRYEED